MTAASHVVVPLQPEDFGTQGLAPVQEAIAAVQAGPNPALTLAGYLLTMVDKRLTVHALRGDAPGVYATRLHGERPPRKDFVEAVACRQPASDYKPRARPRRPSRRSSRRCSPAP